MRFEVPQFIEVEDKIFGPFTFKQFAYLAGGAGIVYIFFRLLPLPFAIVLGIPFGIFAAMLTFYRPNNRPFATMVESFITYHLKNKFYLWKQAPAGKELPSATEKKQAVSAEKALSEKKLKDLAWSLDVLDTTTPTSGSEGPLK